MFLSATLTRIPRRPCLMSPDAIKDEMRQREERCVAQESSSHMIHGPNQPRRYATRENISSRSLLSKLITKSHKFSLPLRSRRQFFKKCSIVRPMSCPFEQQTLRSWHKLSILMFVFVISRRRSASLFSRCRCYG